MSIVQAQHDWMRKAVEELDPETADELSTRGASTFVRDAEY